MCERQKHEWISSSCPRRFGGRRAISSTLLSLTRRETRWGSGNSTSVFVFLRIGILSPLFGSNRVDGGAQFVFWHVVDDLNYTFWATDSLRRQIKTCFLFD